MIEDEEIWAGVEAKEMRLWVSVIETGLWCPTCLLSTGLGIGISRDPAEPARTTTRRCAIDPTHRIPSEASDEA